MKKIQPSLEGQWSQGTTWKFFVTETLPKNIPATAVAGCAFLGNEIFLTKTQRGWEIPGGHIEEGETLEEALSREMKEEAGITMTNYKLFGYFLVNNIQDRNNKATGKPYPKISCIPHYFVEFEEEPGMCTGEDCLDSGSFSLSDPEIYSSNKCDLINLIFQIK